MKKIELITKYNSLGEDLKKLISENANMLTESTTSYIPMLSNSDADRYYKYDLEYMVNGRIKEIDNLRTKIHNLKNKQQMETTAEGRAFIDFLNNKEDELNKKVENLIDSLSKTFNDVLTKIGMSDWHTDYISPSYYSSGTFTVIKDNNRDIDIKVYIHNNNIGSKDKQWTVEVTCAMSLCNGNITVKDKQYYRYKACTYMYEYNDKIMEWLNGVYVPTCKEIHNIETELIHLQSDIKNPYDAWQRSLSA